jgi:type VI secretion system protein ImpI
VLTLRIENFDRLPDGGPISFQANRRGFDLGRDQHLDWTLPDQSRFISGKHCEIRFLDGAYWLYDVSTNGTYVNKSTRRVQSPYKLANGDELSIGEYIISVSVTEPAEPARRAQIHPAPEPVAPPSSDLWESNHAPPPPIDPRDLMPPVQRQSRSGDFLNSIPNIPMAAVPRPEPREALGSPPQPRIAPSHDPWAATGITPLHVPAPGGACEGQPSSALEIADTPFPAGQVTQAERLAAAERPVSPQEPKPVGMPVPLSASDRSELEREFLRRFAQGANLPEEMFARRDAGELAQELGLLMRTVCANLMQLLSARAAAKTLARSGHRTLIQPKHNNPLKFMPSPEEALRVMLGPRSDSYLDANQTLEHSFADLKGHQLATLSAMQLAATQLLADLSPEAIETAAGGPKKSLLGSNKAKFWELFTERWKAKTARRDDGMLGVFLDLFAEFYDREARTKR